MLKMYNFIFYVIYNSYYKHGSYKNDMPPYTVFFIFVIVFYSQLLFLIELYHVIQNPYTRTIGPKSIRYLAFLCFIPTYLLFYSNKKYNVIYNTYKEDTFANSLLAKLMSWAIVVILILSPFIFGLIRNKIYFNEWV